MTEDEVNAIHEHVPASHIQTCNHQAQLWKEFEAEHKLKDKFEYVHQEIESHENLESAKQLDESLKIQEE